MGYERDDPRFGRSRYRDADRGYGRDERYGRADHGRSDYGRRGEAADYDYDDRGFLDRAGDEVRSWFGDEDAGRRREYDARYDERDYDRENRNFGRDPSDSPRGRDFARSQRHGSRFPSDPGYADWRRRQIETLDRDYDEYRREHQSRFDSNFGDWRHRRTTQRTSLEQVAEHMEVVGSDGAKIGTVDKVRGDRIVLTKSEAGGRHHSIPSSWIDTVDAEVRLAKTADEAKRAWRDEERNEGGWMITREDEQPGYYGRSSTGFYY